jgi:hypothetical protein
MEGYKHYLCDLLMRRGKVIERAMVVKLLRVAPDGEEERATIDPVFSERARLLSGLEQPSQCGQFLFYFQNCLLLLFERELCVCCLFTRD